MTRLMTVRAYLAANALTPNSCRRPRWLPERLVRLAAQLEFPLDTLVEAADVSDLNRIVDKWLYWLLSVELAQYPTSAPVAELYKRRLAGDEPTKKEWAAAANAANAAAYAAAYAAYAANAANAAAYAAAYAAADANAAAYAAAYAAADAAYADAAARKDFYERARQALLDAAHNTKENGNGNRR